LDDDGVVLKRHESLVKSNLSKSKFMKYSEATNCVGRWSNIPI